jgi:hypothetical protein
MSFSRILSPAAIAALLIHQAGAQSPAHSRTGELDVSVGRHTAAGGIVDFRSGPILDILLSDGLRASSSWTLIGAMGGSAILGGFGDRCLLRSDGGCAPKANFVVANVVVGPEVRIGESALRLLVGPALYSGADSRSVGAQGRGDAILPATAHIGLGLMVRTTVLPSHGGQRLTASAIGVSLILR